MRAADIAMYRAKSAAAASIACSRRALASEHQRRIDTESALTDAVQRGEFVLAMQPQVSLVTGEVTGAEALLRWNHPRDGMRQPNSFIPIAEQTGIIAEIGDWVIAEVASMLADWQREGIGAAAGVQRQPAPARPCRFLHAAARGLRRPGVPLSMIELEFTEIRGDGMRRGASWPRSPRCGPRARRSRSTISAPAIRTSPGCARCRSTGSSSTRR